MLKYNLKTGTPTFKQHGCNVLLPKLVLGGGLTANYFDGGKVFDQLESHTLARPNIPSATSPLLYSNFRNYAPPLDVKGGIITEKVFPVFSECFFWTCFGLVMYIWELMDVTERLALQM